MKTNTKQSKRKLNNEIDNENETKTETVMTTIKQLVAEDEKYIAQETHEKDKNNKKRHRRTIRKRKE